MNFELKKLVSILYMTKVILTLPKSLLKAYLDTDVVLESPKTLMRVKVNKKYLSGKAAELKGHIWLTSFRLTLL